MNFLNMKAVVNKNMFCDHIMGATIAKYYGRDYELGFIEFFRCDVRIVVDLYVQ